MQKFTWNGSAWTHAYNITASSTGLTGLAVDFWGTNPMIYAVNPGNLWKYDDTGVAGNMTSTATVGANDAFRGLEFAPISEPTAATLMFLGVWAGALALRRRKTARK